MIEERSVLILCPKCEGKGGDMWTDAVDMTNGYDKCPACKGSGRILRITTHKDEAYEPDERSTT